MSHEIIPIQEWLKTFRGAADDLARTSLRFDPASPAAKPSPAPDGGEPGAYIAVLSPNNAVHLGLSASPVQCRAHGVRGTRKSSRKPTSWMACRR